MSYLDTPVLDNTPRAHPAFWRGKAAGLGEVLKIVSDIMLGKDNGTGVNKHNDIENMRRALLLWRERVEEKNQSTEKQVEKVK